MTESALLPYLPPWDWQQFHSHFALRLLPGVEALDDDRYSRSVRLRDSCGWFSVRPIADHPALELTFGDSLRPYGQQLLSRVRTMFDLDADPHTIVRNFAADPLLGPLVAANPGLRLPTAFDPFEQAVRAIVGQQVTVKAAVTITRRLVERLGEPLPNAPAPLALLFPAAQRIAEDSLPNIGMPGRRVEALRRFAGAVAEGALQLHAEDGADALVRRLCALPGIGPWTAEYIALRGFGEADAFPAADLGLLKAPVWGAAGVSAKALGARAQAWRPWRAYATIHLWHDYSTGPTDRS
ncbi:DNA-3-methyladenine glycosylase 2 family protein [Stutzerimonas stutzeri]|uniref:DNA-3-methyladenine glycosylase family protein n=1 Tax=Stutzerimonas sp. S1 TaxID=3030652 RepID=UPI002224642C|nr:AlkA N-terminal domain-containing protein [Stutzerimonas sp. S1]MCW3148250.1 DNA-3-methyladenine glycosylase 2 family protein [Stutzerimonas sp. S1]